MPESSSRPLEIVWVLPIAPFPAWGGNHQRVWHLIQALARRHRVTVVYPAPVGAEVPKEVSALCARVLVARSSGRRVGRATRILHRLQGRASCIIAPEIDELRASLRAALARTRYDVSIGSIAVGPALRDVEGSVVVLDEQNVETDLYWRLWRREPIGLRKAARFHDWYLVRGVERRETRAADLVLACSSRDLCMLRDRFGIRDGAVVPNGVDTIGVPFSGQQGSLDRIVMVGGMSYAPNVEGALFLVRQVMPLIWERMPEVMLDIVGSNPAPEVWALAGPRVTVTGTVPDVRPYLARAAVEVVPLRSGGGTRLKILEAMASGVPVVSTTIGAEGLNLTDGQEVRIADSAAAIAAAVIELLGDPEAARALAMRARQRVEEDYDWGRIGNAFVSTIEQSARASSPRARS